MSLSTPPHRTAPHRDAPGTQNPEALIEEARQRTRRRRSRDAVVVAAVGVVAVLGVGIVWAATDGSGVAANSTRTPAGIRSTATDPFWFTRVVTASTDPLPVVPRVMRAGEKTGPVPPAFFTVRASTETWVGRDGTIRQRTVTLSRRFATAAGRRLWNATHQRLPGGTQGSDSLIAGNGEFPVSANVPAGQPGDPGDGLFSYWQLLSLPRGPAELRAHLLTAEAALNRRELNSYVSPGSRHAQTVSRLAHQSGVGQAPLYILTELVESPIPRQLRTALVAATTGIPGITTRAEPSTGETILTDTGNAPLAVTVSARTGTLISSDGRYAGGGVVVAQGPTTSDRALPRGVRPILGHPSVPAPTSMTVTPAHGAPGTEFRIEIPRLHGITTAPSLETMMFGPTGPNCTFWASRPPIAIVAPGRPATVGGSLVDEYTLPPTAIHRATWCAGTYELQITPLLLASGGSKDLAGPSAAYFTVRP